MKTTLKRIALLLGISTFALAVAMGCNTASGFGKDMEKAGEKIQDGTK